MARPRGDAASAEAQPLGRVAADAFAWATHGSSLIAVDLASRTVFRLDVATGDRRDLVNLPGDVDRSIAPQLAVRPDGQSLALSFGRDGGKIALSVIEFDGNQPFLRNRGLFIGAQVSLSWLNAREIGCLVLMPDSTEALALPATLDRAIRREHRRGDRQPLVVDAFDERHPVPVGEPQLRNQDVGVLK